MKDKVLDGFPEFIRAMSNKKLSVESNPKCECHPFKYCYGKDSEGKIVKLCKAEELKEI